MILFDISNLRQELKKLEEQTMANEFWNDADNSSKVLKQINQLKSKIENYQKIETELTNLLEMTELLQTEPEEEMAKEVLKSTGSNIYIEIGEEIKLEDLIYGLLLRSGNDAAIEIARHIAGSMEEFAKWYREEKNKL